MLRRSRKNSFLQVRVSSAEKAAIKRLAFRAGIDVSALVLTRVLPALSAQFMARVRALGPVTSRKFALADLSDFLARLTGAELATAVAERPLDMVHDRYVANYVAAMVEHSAVRAGIAPPRWCGAIAPLAEPVFGSPNESLRLHLLVSSPAAFRRRNIFVDAAVGDRA